MPRIYRTMKQDAQHLGAPAVGPTGKTLGVREPPGDQPDVEVDEAGNVRLNKQGMSVARHWSHLPPRLIPARLDDGNNGALGDDDLVCWSMGDGPFIPGPLHPNHQTLELVHKSNKRRGNVVPSHAMPLPEFQSALAATRVCWRVDEDEEHP